MNHKRGRPKACRAGCLLCKPNKRSAWPALQLGHCGYGKLRREAHAASDLRCMAVSRAADAIDHSPPATQP